LVGKVPRDGEPGEQPHGKRSGDGKPSQRAEPGLSHKALHHPGAEKEGDGDTEEQQGGIDRGAQSPAASQAAGRGDGLAQRQPRCGAEGNGRELRNPVGQDPRQKINGPWIPEEDGPKGTQHHSAVELQQDRGHTGQNPGREGEQSDLGIVREERGAKEGLFARGGLLASKELHARLMGTTQRLKVRLRVTERAGDESGKGGWIP